MCQLKSVWAKIKVDECSKKYPEVKMEVQLTSFWEGQQSSWMPHLDKPVRPSKVLHFLPLICSKVLSANLHRMLWIQIRISIAEVTLPNVYYWKQMIELETSTLWRDRLSLRVKDAHYCRSYNISWKWSITWLTLDLLND